MVNVRAWRILTSSKPCCAYYTKTNRRIKQLKQITRKTIYNCVVNLISVSCKETKLTEPLIQLESRMFQKERMYQKGGKTWNKGWRLLKISYVGAPSQRSSFDWFIRPDQRTNHIIYIDFWSVSFFLEKGSRFQVCKNQFVHTCKHFLMN
jgi:hypothetical protein